MIASGFAALAYQIVWTQQSALWLGSESAAMLAVVGAFFGGLGFGALAFSSILERSGRPARWYALCECVIGAWSLVLALLLAPVSSALLALIGPAPSPGWHWFVTFSGTFVALLPATAAMGATLPAIERVLGALDIDMRSPIGVLYAANTFGAVLGVISAALWLVPRLGLLRTAVLCAMLNFACAIIALRWQPRLERRAVPAQSQSIGILSVFAVTGTLGIGYEVIAVRALSQVAENTVYTFSILLAIYLIGTTLGAAAYARWSRIETSAHARDRLLQCVAIACSIGALAMTQAESIKYGVIGVLGRSVYSALTAEAVLAIVAFLLPTIAMGALFSHLSTSARNAGVAFSRAFGFNTLGAAIAPLLCGVLLVPLLGLKGAVVLTAIGYLALTHRDAWRTTPQWAVLLAVGIATAWSPSLSKIAVPEGGALVSHVEGATASVSIVEDAHGVATLHINNRQQEGSSATVFADSRQALLPLLLHPAPRRALFLGIGTGVTASAATTDPLLRIDAVELIPEVIDASAFFTGAFPSTGRLTKINADARRFVRTSATDYDLIVSDNVHPARSGSGSLYTVEHFAFVRDRLAPGGVFCQWLPLHQMDLETLRTVVRSFLAVYPHAVAMLATNSLDTPVVGLIARRDRERFELEHARQRLRDLAGPAELPRFGLVDDLSLFGSFIAGPASLRRFSDRAALNTDDRPVVAYAAPRITYSPVSEPRERLIALLNAVEVEPTDLLVEHLGDSPWPGQLVAYWSARDRYLEAGLHVRPTLDVRDMLAQVREPLLAVLRVSPDFRPAYDPLLQIADTLSHVDGDAARALLLDLHDVQPARPQALEALRSLQSQERVHSASFGGNPE